VFQNNFAIDVEKKLTKTIDPWGITPWKVVGILKDWS